MITFNYKEGTERVDFEDIKRSDLKSVGGPSFVDKRDASKNPALWCGIFVHKEYGLLKNKNNWERLEEFGGVKQRTRDAKTAVLAVFGTLLDSNSPPLSKKEKHTSPGAAKPLRGRFSISGGPFPSLVLMLHVFSVLRWCW